MARQSKWQFAYGHERERGKTGACRSGQLTWRAAWERLLAGSDLEWRVINDATIAIKKRTTPATSPSPQMGVSAEAKHKGGVKEQNVQELDDVIVVGSRLGTSPVESAMPIKVINREQLDRSGAGNRSEEQTSELQAQMR